MTRRDVLLASALAGLARPLAAQGQSEAFASRPIRLVVPFPAGGISDVLARAMADALTPRLGQPVVIDNRPGAGGNIGAEFVARATPDGYTLLAAGPAVMGVAKALYQRLNYDPDADFLPIGMLGAVPNVLVINARSLPDPSLAGLIAAAKARPGALTYASSGSGSLTHLLGELFSAEAGIQLLHVPYRGNAQAMSDLVGGQVNILFDAVATSLPLIQAGSVRALGVTSRERAPELPDVPSLVELGMPDMHAPSWTAVYAPAATPRPVVERLRREMAAVGDSASYREILRNRGTQSMPMSEAEMETYLAAERRRWAEAVRRSGARAD
ncbi:Bug family tripartite tricarboxylate transporter substrate binding protein [Falsiroseomonas sp. HW251]|uniref:Bug family tripartite tricarboxylate transporter substrate binding protein n=1 Tax=Falsiroseomonas sp. HW251 TaxID=3390998 RepID=UPI003D317B71